MPSNLMPVLRMALREAVMPAALARTPEPTAEMNSPQNVMAFHQEGAASLLPVYHFNGLAVDRLAPPGARILDIGSGTAMFLSYLASHRPDLRIVGIDFAENMVRVGRKLLAEARLDDRVQLLQGDMRTFRTVAQGRFDVITSIFSLHHLPTHEDLLTCSREIAEAVSHDGTALWIFDHSRPRRRATADAFPEIFTPQASPVFRDDSRNSLQASWRFDELRTALRATLPGTAVLHSELAKFLPLYQIHWTEGTRADLRQTHWQATDTLPPKAHADARALGKLFSRTPAKLRKRRQANKEFAEH